MRLEDIDLETRLGSSGTGQVWRATHRGVGGLLGLKVFHEYHPRFAEEIVQVAALEHPGILRPIAYGLVSAAVAARTDGALKAGAPFAVMEYARGGSLASWGGRLGWPVVRGILTSLLGALAYAHGRGRAHGAVHAGNVLLRGRAPHTGVRLADFRLGPAEPAADLAGLARLAEALAPDLRHTPMGFEEWSAGLTGGFAGVSEAELGLAGLPQRSRSSGHRMEERSRPSFAASTWTDESSDPGSTDSG